MNFRIKNEYLLKSTLIADLPSHIEQFRWGNNSARQSLYNQVGRIMKLTFILIMVALMNVYSKGYSQKVTLAGKRVPIENFFSKIKEQTGYVFFYDLELLKTANPVTLNIVDADLSDALILLFKNQPFDYSIENKTIVIGERGSSLNSVKSSLEIFQNIRGKVIDTKGETLIGVSVRVKGSEAGVSTNVQGDFVLDAPANAVLIFTYIGYVTQEIPVSGRANINVTLVEDRQSLSEVVVTAFGVTKAKRGLGYAVQEVRGEEFTEARMNNVASALTGKIAGVDATQVNSGPGSSSRVIIRGNTSLNGNQQPLYIVDGMPINNTNRGAATNAQGLNVDRGDGISSMNPDDIATISVLKGGAAAALYGSQAANGVILITTKKGFTQKGVGIELSSDANFGSPSVFPNFQYEYGAGNDGVKPATVAAALSAGRISFGAKMDGSMVMQFDGVARPYSPVYVKQNILSYYQTSQNISNTVAFNAGSQSMQMRLSVSDLRSKDNQPNSKFYRKTVNLNVQGKMGKNDFIKIESGVQYNIVEGVNRPNVGYAESAAWPVYLAASTVDVRNFRGQDPNRPGINIATGNELLWNPVLQATNPYFTAYQMGNNDDQQRLIGRASVQVNILPELFIKGTVARDFSYYTESNYVPKGQGFRPLGYFNSATDQTDKTNFQAIANYNKKFLSDKIGMNLMVGGNKDKNFSKRNTANGTEWVVPNFYSVSNLVNRELVNIGQGSEGINSVFGEANIDYKNILYLTVTGRQDWFSVLNPGFNSIFYPSIGGGLILSDVVKMPKLINYAKLRSSWAQVGSATVGAGSINQTYALNSVNADGLPVLSTPNELQNPNIRPVTVTTLEGGFELQILDSRIGLDVNYYSRRTTNDILSPPISQTTGYSAGRQNMGLITNKGWEISLNGSPVRKDNFSWDINYNFGYNQSKIVELAEGISVLSLGSGIGGTNMINAVGLPYSTVRSFVMKRNANGVLIYNKATGYEERVEQDMGVGNPPYLMGIGNNFRYKAFSLTVDIDSKFGAVGYSNLIQYATRFGSTPLTLPGRESGLTVTGVDATGAPYTKVWAVVNLDTYYNNFGSAYPGQFVYKTDFVKLRRAVFKYNLPVSVLKFIKVQAASFGITGLNLATLYQDKRIKEAGVDPEMQSTVSNAQGSQGVAGPRTRNIGFNLNVRF